MDGLTVHLVAAGANQPGSALLRATLAGLRKAGAVPHALPVHLDWGYAGPRVQAVLAEMGGVGMIPPYGLPAPGHVGERWMVERIHSRLNAFGRLRRCPERRAEVVDLLLFLAAIVVVIQQLLRAALQTLRWPTRSTTRRLR